MRDAFGGSFMIKLFLVFLIIYVGFIAVALNYAKAFKVKNAVIDYLEDNEIYNVDNLSAEEFKEMHDYFYNDIIGSMNYTININCALSKKDSGDDPMRVYCQDGIMIYQYKPKSNETNKIGVYYRVSTYFGWNIDFINSLLRLSGQDDATPVGMWEISAETRLITG